MIPTANLTLLYGHLDLEARFEAARRDGFDAVEILFPYDRDPQWYAAQLREHGLRLALVNTPTDALTARWGRAALPAQHADFRSDLHRAAELCEATGCSAVHVMAGCVQPENMGAARATLLDNLSWAAATYPQLILQLEALNAIDVPGYFYNEPASVIGVVEALQIKNLGVQFDFYHVARQGLNLLEELDAALPWIRYVQVAGSPSRNEPDLGRDELLDGFRRLHMAGYRGNVGYEYRPANGVVEGLVWATPLDAYFSHLPAGCALP